MTTSVKRPALLQVNSLQDARNSQLRRQSAFDETDGLAPERANIPNKRRPLKTQSLVLPSIDSPSRSPAPSDYKDLLQYYSDESANQSNSSISSCSSTSSSSSANSEATSDAPSLILPHLYLGEQAQTQMDTLSSLNISYVLSLQSLPKFLDNTQKQQHHQSDPNYLSSPTSSNPTNDSDPNTLVDRQQHGLLPSKNSSKDYLVKIDSNNDSNCEPIVSELHLDANIDELESYVHNHEDCVHKSMDSGSSSNLDESTGNCQVSLLGRRLKKRCDKLSSSMHKLIRGKCINISDTFEQIVDKFFDETHNFIEEARRNRCNVLVHCKAGISRSPTIAIAYLMKLNKLHLQEAYNFVKRCRPQISPNLSFMGQLVVYERKLQMCNGSQLPVPTCSILNHDLKPNHNGYQEKNLPPDQTDLS